MEAIGGFFGAITTGIIVLLVIIVLLLLFIRGYVKAAPDEAVVISGRKKEPKFAIGKATICIPLLERKDKLTLKVIDIDLQTSEPVPTSDFIAVQVDAAVNVKVDASDPKKLATAAQNFLNMKPSEIARIVEPVLEGNVREIIGRMPLKEMVSERQKFAEEVKASAEADMNALGLTIATFNVKNFTDNQKIVLALGVENETAIKRDAATARAQNEKIIREEVAKNEREANRAEVEAQTEIANRENELKIKRAQLKQESDAHQAQADIAYKLQEEEQRQELERRTVQADIARQEKEIELEEKRVAVEQKRLEAEVNKKAVADKYKAEKEAEASLYQRTKNAEAAKIEQSNEAEAKLIVAKKEAEAQKAKAEAAKYAKLQEAEGIKAVGEAEAAAIAAKGDAEAEALDKKAEAMRKFEKAAMMEQILGVMPEIAREIAAPMANIDKVSIYGGGGADGSGFGAYGDAVPAMMGKLFDTMKDATGLDIVDLMHGDSQTAKVNRNINLHLDAPASEVVSKIVDEIPDDAKDDIKDDIVQ